jgi:hypothetical protein
MSKGMMILEKTYDGESIVDLDRDVSEMFDEEFDPRIETIPRDEYNFMKGTFKVTVEWIPE